jgi:hypothetical protein
LIPGIDDGNKGRESQFFKGMCDYSSGGLCGVALAPEGWQKEVSKIEDGLAFNILLEDGAQAYKFA